MKALAMLTMIFLPATFVAVSFRPPSAKGCWRVLLTNGLKTFMSMGLFNWQAKDGGVGPLALVVRLLRHRRGVDSFGVCCLLFLVASHTGCLWKT